MPTFTFSDYFGPVSDAVSSMMIAGETAAGRDPAETALAIGTAAASNIAAVNGSEALGGLSTFVGTTGTLTITMNKLDGQVRDMSLSMGRYDKAVASGDVGAISAAGLNVVSTVSVVVNSIGSLVSAIASTLLTIGTVPATVAAPVASVGLAISAMAGLIAMTATNAVVDAVKSAAAEIGSLLDAINSQSGTAGMGGA
ncbi:hypothetical protein NE850_34785, partial [Paraburkholderia sp. USG1]|uniref:hypothetical protein n=1 Tax=Paraburkholderia sp. USG1 TaxID=2952268 RepID=UPI0028607ABF